jgi:hypothetical protein
VAPSGVALLEPEELDLGLDAVEDVETHCGWRCLCGRATRFRSGVVVIVVVNRIRWSRMSCAPGMEGQSNRCSVAGSY